MQLTGPFWFAAFLAGQLVVIHRCSTLARPGATNRVLAGCLFGLAVSVFLTCHLLEGPVTHGGTVMGLNFETGDAPEKEESIVYFPLPGVGAGPGLPPQGLQATLSTGHR